MGIQTFQPGQAAFLRGFLLPQLQSEQQVTQKILSSVPPGQGSYRPHPHGKSALELARHIVLCEIWFLDAILNRQFGELIPLAKPIESCQEAAELYAAEFARRIPLLEALSDADLATTVQYLDLRNDPAVAYINIAIRHSVHHRGQLSAYLRAMGAKVPAIYVESADEPYPADDAKVTAERPPAF